MDGPCVRLETTTGRYLVIWLLGAAVNYGGNAITVTMAKAEALALASASSWKVRTIVPKISVYPERQRG
jgi:Na+/serine symporter